MGSKQRGQCAESPVAVSWAWRFPRQALNHIATDALSCILQITLEGSGDREGGSWEMRDHSCIAFCHVIDVCQSLDVPLKRYLVQIRMHDWQKLWHCHWQRPLPWEVQKGWLSRAREDLGSTPLTLCGKSCRYYTVTHNSLQAILLNRLSCKIMYISTFVKIRLTHENIDPAPHRQQYILIIHWRVFSIAVSRMTQARLTLFAYLLQQGKRLKKSCLFSLERAYQESCLPYFSEIGASSRRGCAFVGYSI